MSVTSPEQLPRIAQELPSEAPAEPAALARTCGRLAVDIYQVLRTPKVSRLLLATHC